MSSHSVLRNVIQPKTSSLRAPTAAADDKDPFPSPNTDAEGNDLETQLGILVENAPVALSMFDDQMRYIVANRFWLEEFGLQHVQPIIGRSQYDIFPGLHPGWRQVYDRALQGHVVRSEHDAIGGEDGKPVVYRWEVRPWRRKRDASVGGLMVICEKFFPGQAPAAVDLERTTVPLPTEDFVPSALLFECALPVVLLDANGLIAHANEAAAGVSRSREVGKGTSFFWEAFCDGHDPAALKEHTLASIARLASDAGTQVQTLIATTSIPSLGENAEIIPLPANWMLSKTAGAPDQGKFLAIAMPGASSCDVEKPTDSASLAVPASPAVAAASPDVKVLRDLEEKLNHALQEITVLHDAEHAFAKREARQRAVLEALACGLIVLDERGVAIYHNEQVARLLGRDIQRGESVDHWLMQACPTQPHKEKVAAIWAQDVWSRQLARTLTLATADGLLKELEFRPVTLPGGGLLVSVHDVTDQCRVEDLLQFTEAKFRVLLHDTPVGVLLVDKAGAVFEVNPVAEEMIGRAKADLRRMMIDEWLSPESAAARKDALRLMRDGGRRSAALDVQICHASGALRPAHLRVAVVNDADGQPHCTLHFLQSATVEASQSRATVLPPADSSCEPRDESASAAPVAPQTSEPTIAVRWLLQTDQGRRITNWSADAQEVFGFEAPEVVGRWLHSLFRPSDPTGFYEALQGRVGSPDEAVAWDFFGKDGRRGSGRFFVKSTAEGVNSIDLFDEHQIPGEITQSSPPPDISLTRTHIVKPSRLWPVADLDREKLLLSETHHRIKNHLQIISSMLNLQINSLTDQGARAALRSSQNRVRSIAALHQHLYQLALGEGPDFDEFAKGLSQRLRECYEMPEGQVVLDLQITTAPLQPEWMMPLALILNETLSNAFEHAFPDGRRGVVAVRLQVNDGVGELEVSDDGMGLAEGFDPATAPGLGLKILGVFADQMRGELQLSGDRETGTKFNLRFPMAHIDN